MPEIEAKPALAIEGEIVEDEPEVIDPDQTDLSGDLGFTLGPLVPNGPVGSGLMSLADAVEAAADMRARANIRNAQRR